MKNYIKLTEENYFKSLELGLISMDWIQRQATAGSDLLKIEDKVITYDGTILDFRNKYNAINDGYIEVQTVEDLKKSNYKKWIDQYDSEKYIQESDKYIIAKGGDGTLIRAIHMHKDKNKPFFGIASGTVNFMMNSEPEILGTAITKKFQLLNIEISYIENNKSQFETVQAFNDCIIGDFNGWIDFKSQHDESILGDFKGASVIICTAQGSTGANKNNNGTILPLGSKLLSVTGVMTNRRIDHIIENTGLIIECESRGNVTIAIDGSYRIIDGVKNVKISRGSDVEVIFNNYEEFKRKRQN
jgi:NAD+ kinase